MTLALKLLAIVVVTTYMLQIGLATPREAREHGRVSAPRIAGLVRALLVLLVLGPLAARLLVGAFALERRPGAALVLLSLVGVVPLASRGARAAKGDVNFAVVVTACLGVVSAFTAAPTTRLLLGYAGPLQVRTGALLLQIVVLQGVPLAVGLFVRAKTPRAVAVERALAGFNSAVVIVVLIAAVVLLPHYGPVRSLGWMGVLAAVVYAVFLAAASYALVGPDARERRAVAGLSNMPNVMLAILIVASAGVDTGFAIAVVGVFAVRFLTGLVIQKLLARSAERQDRRPVGPQPA